MRTRRGGRPVLACGMHLELTPACLVTGATSGIGRATATELARRGARVIVHGRTARKAEEARAAIATAVPGAKLEVASGDFSSLAEVRALTDDLRARFPRLHVLVNNAGVERWERHVTADGFEETWAVNHLAPFLLTLRLLDTMRASGPARIIIVSSLVHRWGRIDWDDLQLERGYRPERAYYRSKLASLMTSLELARRLEGDDLGVLAVEPGLVRTGFTRDFRGFPRWWAQAMGQVFYRRPEDVAREIADLALGEAWHAKSGLYVARGRVEQPSPRAVDEAAQRRLWDVSARAVGLPPEQPPPRGEPGTPVPRVSLRQWVVACSAGELLGFGAAALWAFAAFRLSGMDPVSPGARVGVLALMVLAGVMEGAVLGALQWSALRRGFRRLRARSWIGATVAVAALGWFLGMLPSTLMPPAPVAPEPAWEPPLVVVLAAAAVFGAIAGAAFGLAQWLVLRRHAYDARRWIFANALGWATGLPWSFLAGTLGDLSESVPRAVVLGALAGTLMGASVALVTGHALSRIQPLEAPPRELS